jgi:serine/threonine-protein kinase
MNEREALERKALRILELSYDLPAAERRSFAEQETAGDPELKARVLRLLDSDTGPGIETAGAIKDLVTDDVPPERIGPWKVTDLIGKGGMGSVYRGVRDDGAFDQTVAIKLVRQANATDKLVARLQQELRVLARLSHPGIATVLDGGALDDGRPYMVIEHIDGKPLLKALPGISRETRLDLFERLLTAMDYAHAMGVVHRDLSPGNVLVREDGVLKVINFGLSGSLHDGAGSGEVETAGYTAPERRAGEPGDARGDIYSLGRLLALLLTETRPPRHRDLSAIIAKATHEEPALRYQSVSKLQDDFRRYRSAIPVSVRSAPLIVAKRFADRYRAATITGLALIGAISAGAVAASVLATRASIAEARAIERSDELRALAKTVMTDLYQSIDGLPQSRRAQDEMLGIAQSYLTQLESDPRADTDLAIDIAEAYLHLAWMAGDAVYDLKFDPEDADRFYEEARARLDNVPITKDNEVRFIEVDSWAKLWLGQRRAYVDFDTAEALALFLDARDSVDRAISRAPDSEALWRRRLSLNVSVAEMLRRGDDAQGTRTAFERTIAEAEAAKKILEDSRPYTELSSAKRLLALVLIPTADDATIEALFKDSVEAVEAGFEASYPRHIQLELYKARAYHGYANYISNNGGDDRQAVALYDQSIAAQQRRRIMDPGNPNVDAEIAVLNSEKALPLARLGRSAEAIAAFQPILELDQANYDNDPARPLFISNMMFSYDTKATLHSILAEPEEACKSASAVLRYGKEFLNVAAATSDTEQLTKNAAALLAGC